MNGMGCAFGCSAGSTIYNARSGRDENGSGMAERQQIFTRGITESGEE
jgi:hypothetical protein